MDSMLLIAPWEKRMNKELILDLFYSTDGNLDEINAAIDEKLKGILTRKITLFDKYIQSRIEMNPRALKMANMNVTPEEAVYISLHPSLSQLEFLDLRKNAIGDEGLQALAGSPVIKSLKVMDLRNNGLTRNGMLAVAESENFQFLEIMDLRTNQLGGNWQEKLVKTGRFNRLKEVRMR